MRTVVLIVGVILLLVGVGFAVYVNYVGQGVSLPAPPNGESYTPTGFGTLTLKLSWSGAPPVAVVSIYSCSDPSCSSATKITSGSGTSGTIQISVTPGHTYEFMVQNTLDTTPAVVTTIGLTYLTILGASLIVVGALTIASGARDSGGTSDGRAEPPP